MFDKVRERRGTPTPLQTALAEVKPLERLKAAFDMHDAAAEGKDGAKVGASQPEGRSRKGEARAETEADPPAGTSDELAP